MKIMFVCHGNICRSPMAEFIFKSLASRASLDGEIECASSATSDEEISYGGTGNPVYPPAYEELLLHGIRADGKRAVQLVRADYEKYDLFIGMDGANIRNMHRIFGGDPDGKIRKLNEKDVYDPWYSGDFKTAYNEIYDGCVRLLRELAQKGEDNED